MSEKTSPIKTLSGSGSERTTLSAGRQPRRKSRQVQPRSNHRHEKYLEKVVTRLRKHNRIIRAKQNEKRVKLKILELADDINKMLRPQ
jgi:hypothetical protein